MDTTPSKLKFSQERGSPNSRLMNSPAASCVNSSASSKRSLFRCARQLSFSSAVDDSYQEAEPALSGNRKPQEPTLIVKALELFVWKGAVWGLVCRGIEVEGVVHLGGQVGAL